MFKRTDGRWIGVVWYLDEQGERKRKSFSGTSKQEVKDKITTYIAAFNREPEESDESRKTVQSSMDGWLQDFKFPSVDCGTTRKNGQHGSVYHQWIDVLPPVMLG